MVLCVEVLELEQVIWKIDIIVSAFLLSLHLSNKQYLFLLYQP